MVTMKLRTLLLLITLFALHGFVAAQEKRIYVTRDANGVVIFSDSPTPGAEEITLTVRPNLMDPVDTRMPDKKPAEPEPFKVSIIQPEEQGTVRDNTGSVYIEGRITPRFQRGFRVRLVFDGLAYGEPQNSAVFVLRDVDRGAHTIQLELLDQNGKLIAVSPVTTFYLHRASVISPN
jgi:hypothetical protein